MTKTTLYTFNTLYVDSFKFAQRKYYCCCCRKHRFLTKKGWTVEKVEKVEKRKGTYVF